MAPTIISVLDSLHSHLQSQTELLPTLHHQLGLPQTALADDLATLQKELTECVERQIDARRKEVDHWMEKCEEVEKQCIRYANALGGHAKASGSSVGEIRKEQILPKRFERITEHQEKLRQLYHTKLEQINTLCNRLAVLARTLGPNFYPPDIFGAPATGNTEDNETEQESCRDVSPERFSKLEKELVRGKGEISKRLNQLSATLLTIDWLHTELGMSPPDPGPDDMATSGSSMSRVPSTRSPSSCSMHTASSSSNDPFLSTSTVLATPTPGMRSSKPTITPLLLSSTTARVNDALPTPPNERELDYQHIFLRFVARLEELPEEEITNPNKPHVGLEGVEPTPGLVSWAEATRIELEEIKRRREAHIQSLYDQLEVLWRRLGVSEEETDAFVEAQRGSTESTVRAYEEELDRMMELKREKMGTFVDNARAEITKLWDDLMVGEEERADFAPFVDDEYTEELLTLHDDEIKSLKLERKIKGPLLANIKKYFDIIEDQKELAAAASDQSRLLGRGPRDPGRLLREEKMRKRVTKEKPKLEQDLLNTIPQWEAENGRIFLVHGRSILQILLEATPANEKENGRRTRSQAQSNPRPAAVPPRARTPSNPVHQYVPVPGSSHSVSKTATTSRTSTSTTSSSSSTSRSTSVTRRTKLGDSTSNVPPGSSLHRSGSNRPPSPKSSAKTSLPNTITSLSRPAAPAQRSVSYQHQRQQPNSALGPSRGTSSRPHSYHPYPQTRRTSPVKATAIRVYGSMTLNSNTRSNASQHQIAMAKKTTRVRRESFKPRPSVDPGDVWSSNTNSDKRFAGMLGGAVAEEDE